MIISPPWEAGAATPGNGPSDSEIMSLYLHKLHKRRKGDSRGSSDGEYRE